MKPHENLSATCIPTPYALSMLWVWYAAKPATIRRLSDLTDQIALRVKALEDALIPVGDAADIGTESGIIRDTLIPRMNELRLAVDEAEVLTAKSYWPYPTYGEILFSVR